MYSYHELKKIGSGVSADAGTAQPNRQTKGKVIILEHQTITTVRNNRVKIQRTDTKDSHLCGKIC
jgi:hypothetical protein